MKHTPGITRPLRFMVGTYETSGFIPDLADGLTRLGHQVTTAMCLGNANFADLEYDMDIGEDVAAVDWPVLSRDITRDDARGVPPPRAVGPRSSHEYRLTWLLRHHDVFVFLFASLWHDRNGPGTLMGVGREFPLLRRLGKRVVSYFMGPEARHPATFDQEMASLGPPYTPVCTMVPRWATLPVSLQLRNIRRAELYANAIFSQPNQASLALRPYAHLFAPVDLSRFVCNIPGRDVPVVVHAPSVKSIKGTAYVVAALDQLRAEGVKFELRLLSDVPNPQVLEALRDADVVIDQVHLPLHGRLGVEAMASGCALATCNREDIEPYPAARPICHLDPAGIVPSLRRLLTDREARVALAHAGRSYVQRHHDHVAVARRIAHGATADRNTPGLTDHTPTYFARHYQLPPGQRVPGYLQQMTARVIDQWGLPPGASREDMVARGLSA